MGKNWLKWSRKGQVWFTDEACNQQGNGMGQVPKQNSVTHLTETKCSSLFVEVAAVLDCVTCLVMLKVSIVIDKGIIVNYRYKSKISIFNDYSVYSQFGMSDLLLLLLYYRFVFVLDTVS